MIQSSFSHKAVEEVAKAAPEGLRWMQIYIWRDRRITEFTIRKAEAAGFKAIVVTVDSPWPNQHYGHDPDTDKEMEGFYEHDNT